MAQNDYQLHHHSLPIVLLSIALFMVSMTAVYVGVNSTSASRSPLSIADQALTSKVFSVSYTKDGLARIHLNQSLPQPNLSALSTANTLNQSALNWLEFSQPKIN